ncbi:polyamine aminopropyltransferase 2 [Streptomyces albospinus]|uniref:Polyamine aminopropyltransferase n=1 Tax=Streptomyces albospinus TaxID=285515 RepID=A0ABQ2UYH9_9ACTN|nr:polyamine aminopropyltransferase [Streptomyces albospinus]GGU60263.1 polyamine aminopropyltransferase 2 [Streptomyces albospinus]
MIDPPEPFLAGPLGPPEIALPARLPVPSGIGRVLVLAVVFVCAACGLVYELELVALASYLIGDSVTEASVVLSVMVFAMGVGALLAKRLRCRAAVGFGVVETALALVGGSSAMALYACFAWFGQSRSVLVGFSLAIGTLIGAEVPLLMTLIQRVRRQDAGGAVADLFAADYVGALVGGLAFPFLLLPCLGQLTGALVTGGINAAAGAVLVLWLFGRELTARTRWALLVANVLVLALLATGVALAGPFEQAARQAVYGAVARVAVQTGVQEVVLTGGTGRWRGGGSGAGRGRKGSGRPLELYLDGRLKVSADNEFLYHEGLVHPAMAGGPHRRVLVLGGGDGLAVRELLRYRTVRSVTVVEIDPGVVRLARTDPGLSALNGQALGDPRVRVVAADAFNWLRQQGTSGAWRRPERYDVIVSDLPDPGITASTKLYSQEFYGLALRLLADDGRMVVHAGPPCARPRTYWTVDATLRSVGLATLPYRIPGRLSDFSGGPDRSVAPYVEFGRSGTDDRASTTVPHLWRTPPAAPSCGVRYWGFLLAGRQPPRLAPAPDGPSAASVVLGEVRASRQGAVRDRIPGLSASTLMRPRYLE